MRLPPVRTQLALACALRLALVAWGLHVDASQPHAPYTDVDYSVFTDAAAALAAGGSPYERDTYALFCAADAAVGWVLADITRTRGAGERAARLAAAAWLFNPYTAGISTRGSCDAMPTLAVLLALRALIARRTVIASACYAACGGAYAHEALLHHVGRADPRHNFSPYWYAMHLAEHVDAAEAHALDADVAAAARDALGAPAEDDGQGDALRVGVPRARLFPAGAMRLLAFVPQLAVVVALPLALSADLPLCLFAQTAAFVVTAQYFAWWFALAPLCLVGADVRAAARSLAVWIAAQVHWLAWAWALEMRGDQTLWPVFREGTLAPPPAKA
eukprot:PRCOL_00005536-RA